ncbi:hypothetical protein J2X77_000127 [Sphingobacterium sp. 2149]|nr:hypothetical protein [Sphingobacterium sp. 2149]MDR6733286.1 hypothetical protein [Sphingobacterium sp. 2149]
MSIFARFKRSELKITETELKLMAAAAIIGDSRITNDGYSSLTPLEYRVRYRERQNLNFPYIMQYFVT